MLKPAYRCSQSVLYETSKLVLVSLNRELKEFSRFKTRYNNQFTDKVYLTLDKAMNMPDFQNRNSKSSGEHIEMKKAFLSCATHWQTLKRYIIACYPENFHEALFEKAGIQFYKKANLKHWESARLLLISAQNFLNLHKDELMANENMPSEYPALFSIAHSNFSKYLFIFQQSEIRAKEQTAQKIDINNQLFELISEICLDGQIIFKSQTNIKSEFIFSHLLKQVAHRSEILDSEQNEDVMPQSLAM